jgi:hypothetical protein
MDGNDIPPKRPRGRPRVDDGWEKFTITVRASDLARIDALRGDMARSTWMRDLALRELSTIGQS